MAFEIEKFASDASKEEEGVWCPLSGDAALLIARLGNSKFAAAYGRIPPSIRNLIEKNRMDNDQAMDFYVDVVARTVLLGWKNITRDGEDISYSVENAKDLLKNYRNFRNEVISLAEDEALFSREAQEENLGNSSSASDGTSPTEET